MRRTGRLLCLSVALGLIVAWTGAGAAPASAQTCVPGAPPPLGCPAPPPPPPQPPPPPPPAPGPPGGGGGTPPPPPPEPAGCALRRSGGRGDFVGIVTEDVFAGGTNYRRRSLSKQADAGVKIIRQTFHWSQIESSRGRYDFGYYDAYMASVAAHRIRVLPILFSPPSFHSSAPSRGARRGTYPPRSYAAMGRFAAAVARRYGPRGSFWRQNRRLPKVPIRSWQVWNEPNLRVYWPRGANPRQYTRLLRTVGRAVKRVDRRAEIVTAGLPESRIGVPLKKYVTGMYRAGARSAFDTLAINPYARSSSGVIRVVSSARRVMRRFGDRRGRIWVTEVGWSTDGPRSSFKVGSSGQAKRIRGTLRGLHRARRRLGVRGVIYYNWRDSPPYAGGKDFWGLHTGLLDINGRAKPGLSAFRKTARKLR